ncbi:uncharacterized protein LOC123529178 [Mercenaria mercenaria]|uniref:uncharacterized protein LOC123529178 n=1 Tax=Mercenaria mercenaria TaxID=6596 RepID=UPI00234F7187|nr:uncharacterized protein LOC123529178 [Mercenaria mercenaria]
MAFILGKLGLYAMLVVFVPFVSPGRHKYSLLDNVRYSDIFGQHLNTSKIQCIALCDDTKECTSVNHKMDTGKCELSPNVPRVLTPAEATEPSWRVYYNDRIIRGVDAWQMSTFTHINGPLSASYAIDGNRDNNDLPNDHLHCAHTASGNSFWGMEFERVADVSYVLLFFRNDSSINERNSNLRLLISSTRQDADNNVGTDCATFVGPPASPSPPTKVTCTQPVTGKFLKIIHNNPNGLTLCEVEVYST